MIENEKCKFKYMFSEYEKQEILSGISLECNQLIVQIVLVYNRGNFLWIPSNSDIHTKKSKCFGDVVRALRK